jgi:cobalt/nickel transport system permease protein
MLRVIDRYAFTNRLRMVDPAQKSAIALTTIVLCLVLDRPLVSGLALLWMVGLAIGYARLPWRVVIAVLSTESMFLMLSVIGIAVRLGVDASTAAVPIGPFWVSMDRSSVLLAGQVFIRVIACVSALNVLALTTPLVDLIDLFHRWRIPTILIEVMILSYRAIFLLLDTLERMVIAQKARLGYASWRSTLRSSALIGSQLFMAAYQRSRMLEQALIGRGFCGEVRVLPIRYHHDWRLWAVLVLMVITVSLARMWG